MKQDHTQFGVILFHCHLKMCSSFSKYHPIQWLNRTTDRANHRFRRIHTYSSYFTDK
jgi:hypothetical protein